MKKVFIIQCFVLILAFAAQGQRRATQKPAKHQVPNKSEAPVSIQTAVTKDGKTVLLRSNGTWEYTSDPVVENKQPAGYGRAIKALRVMAGATAVGINFTEYGRRLVDMKAEVDDALLSVPDGATKDAIVGAVVAYVDAGQAWNRLIQQGGTRYSQPSFYPDKDPWADALQRRYNISAELFDARDVDPSAKPYRIMSQSDVLNDIWKFAIALIEKAEKLTQ